MSFFDDSVDLYESTYHIPSMRLENSMLDPDLLIKTRIDQLLNPTVTDSSLISRFGIQHCIINGTVHNKDNPDVFNYVRFGFWKSKSIIKQLEKLEKLILLSNITDDTVIHSRWKTN